MKEFEVNILNPTGLHARPAKVFVNTAKKFVSDIRVHHGEKKANAKSLISMLALGVETGAAIRVVIDGADEDEAFASLQEAIAGGLGEGEMLEADKPAAAPAGKGREKAAAPAAPAAPPEETEPGTLRGVPGAPGIAIGPLFRLKRVHIAVEPTAFRGIAVEERELRQAIEEARIQLAALSKQMRASGAAEEAEIFAVHREILDDPDLLDLVLERIQKQHGAAQSWQATITARAEIMAALPDPTLAARAADLHDVGNRVLRLLVEAEDEALLLPERPAILIAEDLAPSDTASLPRDRVLGFCTARGGPTSHSAIIARALQLPAVVSAGAKVLDLANDTLAILDGAAGKLLIDPDADTLAEWRARQKAQQEARAAAARAADEPAVTTDGRRVEIAANIGGIEDARQARASGAEAVGLLRTEFLFLERDEPPTAAEQYEVYSGIAKAMQGRPVIVRTLDIGGDKPLAYIKVAPEENPFLGVRGIRLCMERPELLGEQLRSILRAAAHGPLRIMFPMVSDLSEWRAARRMVEEARREVDGPEVELGIMVEVPSAALLADVFAPEVDFFSVGTNDLTQYTLAMDRGNPQLAGRSDGLHPAVLRLIAGTVKAAHAHGKWVGVCGELGADPVAVPLLIGLGVDELSVTVPAIPTVKAQVRTLSAAATEILAQKALACATAEEVRALVAPEMEG